MYIYISINPTAGRNRVATSPPWQRWHHPSLGRLLENVATQRCDSGVFSDEIIRNLEIQGNSYLISILEQ